jgi:hypothetical protein
MNLFYYNWVMVDDDLLLWKGVIKKTHDRKSHYFGKKRQRFYCCAM